MADFKSKFDYVKFALSVTSLSRYFLSPDAKQFVESVLETSCRRELHLPRGATLWPAQLGCAREDVDRVDFIAQEPRPFGHSRMKPLRDRASEGRVNPKGIPALYLARHRETALSEALREAHVILLLQAGTFLSTRVSSLSANRDLN